MDMDPRPKPDISNLTDPAGGFTRVRLSFDPVADCGPLQVMFPSFSLPLDVLWRPNLQQVTTEAQLAQDCS